MPALGATDPADLQAQARAELGFSLMTKMTMMTPSASAATLRTARKNNQQTSM
jgi:hypothetical protein